MSPSHDESVFHLGHVGAELGAGLGEPVVDPSRLVAMRQPGVAEPQRQLDYLRRHGPFEPHRLPLEDLEYTTMHQLEQRLADRWEPMAAAPLPVPR
ncbi:fructose 1,6-bisphosphatase [Lentzea terrae]|uniref:fructose 1,6-bisphosphatase n=1 Tax=Lentzea terrae TaxID=2200761 RepID=UPI001E35F919|nr:fructose 1,6-bisphosphatase [Lentzea terrae]